MNKMILPIIAMVFVLIYGIFTLGDYFFEDKKNENDHDKTKKD